MDSTTNDFQLPLPMFGDERRIYYFYQLLNTVNSKSYVGLTTHNSRKRKQEHLGLLEKDKHHSQKLQRAYNKYGEDVFQWNILERGVFTLKDASERERYWIRQLDSFKNGYNMNEGGQDYITPPIPCEWNGITYNSITDAAIALGIEPSSMGYRVAQGYVCDDDLTYGNIPVEWNGTTYDSISETAKALGLTPGAIRRRVFEYGYKSDADMKGKEKPITWDGIEYESTTQAAEMLGIARTKLYKYLDKGYTSIDDVREPLVPCVWNGVEYPSLSECAKALGVNQSTVRRRLDRGWVCDEDVKASPATPVSCEWNGIQYRTLTDAAQALGISDVSMANRLKRGYTCDDDMLGKGNYLKRVKQE